jgi:hypothetical protein
MRTLWTLGLCFSLSAMGFSQATAQDDETAKAPTPCNAAQYHQFDFWIGDWTVSAAGQPAGTNSIHPVVNGCALQENWQGTGPGGTTGRSFNLYDQATGKWHQTWIDSGGTLLQLDGGLEGSSMVMQGQRPAPNGIGMTTHRISWTPNPDGSVRQLWEASRDGETWTVLFDGLYEKSGSSDATQ